MEQNSQNSCNFREVILLKYGEVVLKGLNRSRFDSILKHRVKDALKKVRGSFTLDYAQSTLFVRGDDEADILQAFEVLKKVFGIVMVCKGIECEKDIEQIKTAVRENMSTLIGNAKTFKCEAKRSDKAFPYDSPRLCATIGELILSDMPQLSVDVKNPQATVVIEIRDRCAFIHGGGERGAGGMPSGSAGRVLLMLSGGIDSPVAGYMVAKRGALLDAVYFETPPYTGDAAKEKVITLAKKLSEYSGKLTLHCISITDIQDAMRETCEQKMFTLILRRFMLRLAQKTAESAFCEAIVTGESIGQVASQTLSALRVTDSVATMPVFRPCIGLDKEEIVARARAIGTFDTSNLPYEDCCTVFTPKHPETNPTIEQALEQERELDVESLVEKAFLTRKVIRI